MPYPIHIDRATAALELGLRDRDTVTKYMRRGWLHGTRIGRRVLITRSSLDHLLAKGQSSKR